MALEIIAAICLVGSGFFALIAGLGLVRFRDLASRMHAATKASGESCSAMLVKPTKSVKSTVALS